MHTSRTDVELAELPGDLTLDSGDLRVNQAKGQVRVVTRSKDIDLNQIYGDSYVETRNGRIAVEPAGAYSVEAKNNKRRRRGDAASQRLGHRERCAPTTATSFRIMPFPQLEARTSWPHSPSAPAHRGSCSTPATATCTSRKVRAFRVRAFTGRSKPAQGSHAECSALPQDSTGLRRKTAEGAQGAAPAARQAITVTQPE